MRTDLSPAAQAVLDAFWNGLDCGDDWDKANLAAVLRAAALYCKRDAVTLLAIAAELEGDGPAVSADREPASVVPEPTDKELCETYVAAYYAAKNRQGPAAQAAGLRAVLQKWGAL